MPPRPTFNLERLREIGWSKWDPLGVSGPDRGWPSDEYDTYLLQAAGQLWNGWTDEAVATYLARVEAEDMGLTAITGIHSRALNVAKAIRRYVETLRA
jgi:hypothetical protein